MHTAAKMVYLCPMGTSSGVRTFSKCYHGLPNCWKWMEPVYERVWQVVKSEIPGLRLTDRCISEHHICSVNFTCRHPTRFGVQDVIYAILIISGGLHVGDALFLFAQNDIIVTNVGLRHVQWTHNKAKLSAVVGPFFFVCVQSSHRLNEADSSSGLFPSSWNNFEQKIHFGLRPRHQRHISSPNTLQTAAFV